MRTQLHDLLEEASMLNALPAVVAYNRIDGPGSSLDLREFQQALWSLPQIPEDIHADPSIEWSRKLPRTIGMTINIGTRIIAYPFTKDSIGIRSVEYGTETIAKAGEVPPSKENWLLKILDVFGLTGVMIELQNLQAGTQSSGFGGSATATTGVCILANELAGHPLSNIQLISMASRMEQDLGVSITGTQEQSNVVFGGVTDYLWFPWGIPGKPQSNYGESLRYELLHPKDYKKLEKRMAIFHSGHTRPSTDVNTVWRNALSTSKGYQLHKKKLEIAYQFREGIRLCDWERVFNSIKEYYEARIALCPDYMNGAIEIIGRSASIGCVAFPLGAGGGGGILIFSNEIENLNALRKDIAKIYREIPFKFLPKGHELINLPIKKEK